ncbi:MAG: RrF2 family protein [Caulobacteraceae bacterium]|nr:RrF2 family protein [Caulobacteraceae bacterium]
MRLSTRGRYAVMAMTDLASRGGERAVALADIAGRQQISLAYLEQLFARLRKRGLVVGARGPGGGYRLSRGADEISIAAVVEAVDEPLRATRCRGTDGAGGCMKGGEACLTHGLWAEMGRVLADYLAAVTLADVAAGRVGVQRQAAA